jgi:iron(III) transport system ATP-binding protein
MTLIALDGVGKRFGATPALCDISLDFPSGSFTALLGPSGCGKTTLLRLIAGFETPSSGEIRFAGRPVADPERQLPPEARGVGMVFQSYALWPHMNVFGNVAYPLRTRGLGKAAIAARVAAVLETVGLEGFAERSVEALSGGQRQRVALARCLVADTGIVLFDEPLANLDVHLRQSMLAALRDIHRRIAATIVYVTHDQSEALALADRVAVLDRGVLQQLGTPQQIYAEPASAMVAGFVGRGSLVAATLRDGWAVLAGHGFQARGEAAGAARLLLRPEALRPAETGIAVRVADLSYQGPVYEVTAVIEATGERLLFDAKAPPEIGGRLTLAVDDAWIVPA